MFVQYQSAYSRHFMPLGEKERQDREVFQRNMKSRMETFKSTRYKRHKKERSLKKVYLTHRHTHRHTDTHTAAGELTGFFFFPQRRGSDTKDDGGEKPRRNVSWQDKGKAQGGQSAQGPLGALHLQHT